MVSWREINEAIARCRRSGNIVPCLAALFGRYRDGHVAAALAEEYERLGKIEDARRWFTEAIRLYPKPEYKARAQSALRRLGSAVQPASSETPPAQGLVLHIIECSKRKSGAWVRHLLRASCRQSKPISATRSGPGSLILALLRNAG